LSANANTLKAVIILGDNYKVDFRPNNSIGKVLGFNSRLYGERYQESENVVNIMSINSILVNIDIIAGSYVNGSIQPTVYSFFPNVSPGYKIIETPHNLVYLPVTQEKICSMLTTLTDQTGKVLNLRGEAITMRLHLREV